ncbi:hypothetical protein AVEN_172069-1 [Araneus ventricosus]|uniref:Uncharacterized protein n=1 Tax=Araneus ventricosus TaxID=182803 RepID=A0A4Y2SQ71_ARAVE|nr:hypothetical protein AVEN_172069-1 [Araneus ventricosus]
MDISSAVEVIDKTRQAIIKMIWGFQQALVDTLNLCDSLEIEEEFPKHPEFRPRKKEESELFSYIGGLVGCWFGISVFTFTDVFEKFVKMVVVLKGNYRRKREQAKIRNRKTEKGIAGKRKKEKRSRKSPSDVKEV